MGVKSGPIRECAQREVHMLVSTRSFVPAMVLVLTACLFLAATDARGQSQFVTVTFQSHITSVFQSALGSLPASVSVGNPITGFFVYDLTKSTDGAPQDPNLGYF